MKKVIITGPESSGKTTLAKELSAHYQIDFVREYARAYLTNIGSDYDLDDVLKIAVAQHQQEKDAAEVAKDFLLCDTDLITIKIWLEYKYGRSDEWVDSMISNYKKRIYLLCSPDMEWSPDELRENPGDREELFHIYKGNLEYYHLDYHIIEGPEKYRKREAISIIESSY